MSVDDNISGYNSVGINENVIFVNLLSKYKIILEKPTSNVNRRKQDKARIAITKEFNEKCDMNLTMKQILRKLNNIKTRLKEKNFKNLSRSKQIPFLEWERKFLDLWEGNGVTFKTKKLVECKNQPKNKSPKEALPEDIIMKFETAYSCLEDDPHTSSETSSHSWEPTSETKPSETDKRSPEYEWSSLDELKRGVLICQMKTLQAQEAAARATEKLKLYKLLLLQQNEFVTKREIQ